MKKVGEQLQMFSTEGMETRPGQKSFDQWLNTENPVYHGTFRSEDFGNAEAAHFGTLGQASYRLNAAKNTLEGGGYQRDRYYDPSASAFDLDEDQVEPFTHTGRVHARRMTEAPMRGRLMDADANAAEAGFLMKQGYEDWEVPSSVSESAGTVMPTFKWGDTLEPEVEFYTKKSAAGARALEAGRPVKYKNFIESDNPIDAENGMDADTRRTSFIVPRGAQQSWEGDVIMDRGNPDWMKDWARKRIQSGQESAVPFPSMNYGTGDEPRQMNFYDLYDPGAPEPNAPPFPRELAARQERLRLQQKQRPILNQVEFEA